MSENTYRKVKVLNISGITIGGIEALMVDNAIKMNKKNVEVHFFSPTVLNGKQTYKKKLEDNGIQIHFHREKNNLDKIISFYKLLKLIKAKGPFDTIHSHSLFFSGFYMLLAKLANIPIRISHSHTDKSNLEIGILRKMYEILMRNLILKYSTDMIAPSYEAASYLFGRKGINDKRTTIIPNGIDYKRFDLELYNRNDVLKELKLNHDLIHLVLVGRFVKIKNHKFIVDVFTNISKKFSNVHLSFVGEGKLKEEIQQYVISKNINNRVSFLGARDDIPKILAGMDLFLLPSKWEGFGIVLVEAQAMGLKCIASNRVPTNTNLGNVTYLPINEKVWESEILNHIKYYKGKQQALKKPDYDIDKTSELFYEIYSRNIIVNNE
ncbi:glycosyltransferase [Gracilibacillus lacisalsi]|uniref:glycosyltransferase n=1 Tax=Gracilibacillus lacisalsi TaxID=393087 RepID=UPI00037285EC|nr:glycosyltransferase [Gracilibacillus lacisalsi]